MTSINHPKARNNELVVQELKDEVLIFDLSINKAYSLNPTSTMIWNLCDGTSSVSDISRKLSEQFKQPVTEDLVWLALDGLKKHNLLEHAEELTISFNGLSRRQIIRKVGFASMIALPVISSMIAPTAAMAQSGGTVPGSRTLGQSCLLSPDCADTAPVCFVVFKVCYDGTRLSTGALIQILSRAKNGTIDCYDVTAAA